MIMIFCYNIHFGTMEKVSLFGRKTFDIITLISIIIAQQIFQIHMKNISVFICMQLYIWTGFLLSVVFTALSNLLMNPTGEEKYRIKKLIKLFRVQSKKSINKLFDKDILIVHFRINRGYRTGIFQFKI